jgi:hypothetical protein
MSVKVTTTVTEQDVALPTRAPVADIVSGTGAATSSSRQLALRNGNSNSNSASQAIGGSVRTPVKSATAGAAAAAVAAASMMMSTLRSATGTSTLLNGTGSPSAPRTPPAARTPTRCVVSTLTYLCYCVQRRVLTFHSAVTSVLSVHDSVDVVCVVRSV